MSTEQATRSDTVEWLLDSDPGIRWQVMRDLLDSDPSDLAAERGRVAREGWGARLLDLQWDDGSWAGGAHFPKLDSPPEHQPWNATSWSLQTLRQLGVDPNEPRVRDAVGLVRENVKWEYDGEDFFDGEVEPCINGLATGLGAYFGDDVDGIVTRLLGEQMADGGWNCEQENGSTRGSFDTTISVLEGFAEYEASDRADAVLAEHARAARERGQEYLLDRHLMRRLTTGEITDYRWQSFAFPPRWHYDVLRALDHFQRVGAAPDPRLDEALDLVEQKAADGRWMLDRVWPGEVAVELEVEGEPSRWNTLRALRVLRRYRPQTADVLLGG